MNWDDAPRLDADEIVPERPFTDPANSGGDLRTMRRMAHQLVELYGDPEVCDFAPGKRPVCQSDPRGYHFRIYYIQPDLLFARKNLTVVGFFGHKRPDADIKPLLAADKIFTQEFDRHAGLLSLSTMHLDNGDFANLVLFTDDDAKDYWNYAQPHHDLVAEIAPPYYAWVRLNNGILPDGLDSPDSLQLTRVKYIDYQPDSVWRAIRQFDGVQPRT